MYPGHNGKSARLLEICPRFCRACRPTPRRHFVLDKAGGRSLLALGLRCSGWRHGVGRLRRTVKRPSGPLGGIEHASNSPRTLRAIARASRYASALDLRQKRGQSERPGRFANDRARARLLTPTQGASHVVASRSLVQPLSRARDQQVATTATRPPPLETVETVRTRLRAWIIPPWRGKPRCVAASRAAPSHPLEPDCSWRAI